MTPEEFIFHVGLWVSFELPPPSPLPHSLTIIKERVLPCPSGAGLAAQLSLPLAGSHSLRSCPAAWRTYRSPSWASRMAWTPLKALACCLPGTGKTGPDPSQSARPLQLRAFLRPHPWSPILHPLALLGPGCPMGMAGPAAGSVLAAAAGTRAAWWRWITVR